MDDCPYCGGKLVFVEARDATEFEPGCQACYECADCGRCYESDD